MLLWSCGAKFEGQVLCGLVLSTILACDGVERHERVHDHDGLQAEMQNL
jgi:hypothetical protein